MAPCASCASPQQARTPVMTKCAKELSLKEILLLGTFEIPGYQRAFTWNQDRITPFINMILRQFRDNRTQPCFLGIFVFRLEKPANLNNTKAYSVVDGQQRLMTLFTFLATVRDLLLADAPTRESILDITTRCRFFPHNNNLRDALMTYVCGDRGTEIAISTEAPYTMELGKVQGIIETCRRCISGQKENYNFNYDDLAKFLLLQARAIVIEANALTDALKICTAINTPGTAMTVFELLRAEIFRTIQNTPRDVERDLDNLKADDEGKLTMEGLVHYYQLLQMDRARSIQDEHTRDKVLTECNDAEVSQLQSPAYIHMLQYIGGHQGGKDQQITHVNKILRELTEIRNLMCWTETNNKVEAVRALRMLTHEKPWNMWITVAARAKLLLEQDYSNDFTSSSPQRTIELWKSVERFFAVLVVIKNSPRVNALERHSQVAQDVFRLLNRWPSEEAHGTVEPLKLKREIDAFLDNADYDAQFWSALESNMYAGRKYFAGVYILRRLNLMGLASTTDLDFSDYQIEHAYPTAVCESNGWPAPSKADKPKLNYLGNLLLLRSDANREARTARWKTKQRIYSGDERSSISLFRYTLNTLQEQTWNIATIERRTNEALEKLAKLYGNPRDGHKPRCRKAGANQTAMPPLPNAPEPPDIALEENSEASRIATTIVNTGAETINKVEWVNILSDIQATEGREKHVAKQVLVELRKRCHFYRYLSRWNRTFDKWIDAATRGSNIDYEELVDRILLEPKPRAPAVSREPIPFSSQPDGGTPAASPGQSAADRNGGTQPVEQVKKRKTSEG